MLPADLLLLGWRMGFGPLIGQFYLLLTLSDSQRVFVPYFFVNGRKFMQGDPNAPWYHLVGSSTALCVQSAYGMETAQLRLITDGGVLAEIFAHLMQNRPQTAQRIAETVGLQSFSADLAPSAEKLHMIALDAASGPAPAPLQPDLVWATLALVGMFLLRARARRPAKP